MTILCALLVLLVAILVTTIRSLYDLTILLFIWLSYMRLHLITGDYQIQCHKYNGKLGLATLGTKEGTPTIDHVLQDKVQSC